MALVRTNNWTCNNGTVNEGELPPGYCQQDPIDGISLIENKSIFELLNSDKFTPKIARVRRTFSNGAAETFSFRVNPGSGHHSFYEVAWLAPQDAGAIELIEVDESPIAGGMDAFEKMEVDLNDNPVPSIVNNSPHWVFIGVTVISQAGDSSPFRVVTPPNYRLWISERSDPPRQLIWSAAEAQRTDLYAPFP